MIDIVLIVVIIALLLYMVWERYQTRKEQSKFINAIIAKTPEQMRDLEFVDKVQVPKVEKPQEDLLDPANFSDEKFMEVIQNG